MSLFYLWSSVLLVLGSSSGSELFLSNFNWPANSSGSNDTEVQELCDMLVNKYNVFVDMVPLVLPVGFSDENSYFTGNSEVMFYQTSSIDQKSPKCSMFKEKDMKLVKICVTIRMTILNNGHRMDIDKCTLSLHLRIDSSGDKLQIRPVLVDVRVRGPVSQDGVPVSQTQAEEVLRPTLMKAFTAEAEKYLSFNDFRSTALFVDPSLTGVLLKQLFLSYMSQL